MRLEVQAKDTYSPKNRQRLLTKGYEQKKVCLNILLELARSTVCSLFAKNKTRGKNKSRNDWLWLVRDKTSPNGDGH